ncbi:Protein of unknown function [Oryzisolibacter propanilivorax]|uniref:DUF2818 domain-containing protein n=1 Tax=Oryzisolibacter propanilivorax TaxID=1527607 RepID=A0A1G9RAA1_9BURK|nr:DUF2818 family protein [Oryzisolibacter propanilivorax]SDM19777.1 Protein of unknown function [Oryzisolibacter propanilivorax]
MTQNAAIWLVILAAFAAANLPFLNDRWLVVGPVARSAKPFGVRLLELILLYFLVGALALLIEKRAGQIAPQGWEFYAVTAALFITLAFPGFVYRYLVRRKGTRVAEEDEDA